MNDIQIVGLLVAIGGLILLALLIRHFKRQ